MQIYLIRHGESTSDIDNLFGGDYEDHLTGKGRSQAKELAQKIRDKKIEIIYSSPRWRAKETAEILTQTLNCPIEIIEDLRERNAYGFLTGKNKDEAKLNYPKEVEALKHYSSTIKGAETYEDFKKRILSIYEKLINSDHKVIGILTHGGPIRCLAREILGMGELKKLDDCALFELNKE